MSSYEGSTEQLPVYTTPEQEKEQSKPPSSKRQSTRLKGYADRAVAKFQTARFEKDKTYSVMRDRNWVDIVTDSKALFHNYRKKPDWKDEWQANISDITTHSKIMALVAIQVANRMMPTFVARRGRDVESEVYASIYNSIADYINNTERNAQMDYMFTSMLGMRDGTALKFIGFQDSDHYTGLDVRFMNIDEAFPGSMKEFNQEKQPRFIWRVVQPFDEFTSTHTGSKWIDVDKVCPAGEIYGKWRDFFNISEDLPKNMVEKLIIWDKIYNEFVVVANNILISKPGTKLSDIQRDKMIPVVKYASEAYDPGVYPGRPVPDLMRDNQEGIDFLFNSMYDTTLLSTMKPTLVGGVNDLAEDYWYPAALKQVADVNQVKQLDFDGVDLNAFRILKELQDRNVFVSVDPSQQGVAMGNRTATEVERANQAQRLKTALLSLMVGDSQLYEFRLLCRLIKDKYIDNEKFRPFIIEHTKLLSDDNGTRIVDFTDQLPPTDQFGYSPKLAVENAKIKGPSEIIKASAKKVREFEVDVKIDFDNPPNRLLERAGIRDYVNTKLPIALQRPDLLDAAALLEEEARATPGLNWEKVRGKKNNQPMGMGAGQDGALPRLSNLGAGAPPLVTNSPLGAGA